MEDDTIARTRRKPQTKEAIIMKRILTTLMTIMLMMGMAGSAETVYQEIPLPVSAQPTFYTCTDASGNTYDLFEIVKWQEDENHHVTAVTGRFERVVTEEDCETGAYADDGQTVTFPLAADFSAMMLGSMTDADMQLVPVTDLRAWYISAYLDDTAPESGEIVFQHDASQESETFDFWFITVQIRLNDAGEIAYMEYVYVPWA